MQHLNLVVVCPIVAADHVMCGGWIVDLDLSDKAHGQLELDSESGASEAIADFAESDACLVPFFRAANNHHALTATISMRG